ncbi:ovate family protein 8 [Perilla frutescens var. frutescens]|nr:ovate family protein 8 [Perilla frutescens var. frutescens]
MEEGPLETRVRTRRFKRYGSKDWRDGSTAKPEHKPSEKAVSGRPRRAVAERHENRSFVVVKRSVDPYQDFKKSILEMILERGIFEPKDLEQLLMSFLSLNSRMHHKAILKAFSEIWKEVFSGPSNQS